MSTRHVLRLLAAALLVLFSGALADAAVQDNRREYAVKAVYLYNFSQFIDWPASAFASPSAPLTIGIYGQDPFGSLLEEAVRGETSNGRPIRVLRIQQPGDAAQAHVLFISRAEAARMGGLLPVVRGRSIVTVGESEAFLDAGGMFALETEAGKVRLRINPATVRAANVTVSSKLMRIATQR